MDKIDTFPSPLFDYSPELDKIFTALSKAQGEIFPAKMDSINPHFQSKYASLTACQEAYRHVFKTHGLAITQLVGSDGDKFYIRSILGHSSGQWISSTFRLLIDRSNMQGLGSAITYGRRYGVNSLVGVVDTEDDDGNLAITAPASKPQTQNAARETGKSTASSRPPAATPLDTPKNEATGTQTSKPSAAQLTRLYTIATSRGWRSDHVKDYMFEAFGISSSKDLSLDQYDELVMTMEQNEYSPELLATARWSNS